MTSIFKRSDDLRSGHLSIEREHRQLVGLFDQALALFEAERLLARDALHALLNELAAAVDRNFRAKESLLRASGCPTLAKQCSIHEFFREQVAGLVVDAYYGRLGKSALRGLRDEYLAEHNPCNEVAAMAGCYLEDVAA